MEENFAKEWEKLHAAYEIKAYKLFYKEFKSKIKSIPFENFTKENYILLIAANLIEKDIEIILRKVWYSVGVTHGTLIEKKLNNLKKGSPPLFSELFQKFILDFISKFGGTKIKSISDTLVQALILEFKKGLEENLSIRQIVAKIKRNANNGNLLKYQILRIARTETTFASNNATYLVGQNSNLVLNKVWIGRNDGRERDTHIAANNTEVGLNERFKIGSDEMLHPGDHSGRASNVINCRCTIAYKPKRDQNGLLIFK